MDEAIRLVLETGETVSEAARRCGVSRSHVSRRVNEIRREREAAAQEGGGTDTGSRTPVVFQSRRVPDFETWWQAYFGRWVCPDCDVHHEMPDFHREIIDAVESDARRVLVNVPPYHSKSTLVTVWHTVYDICRDPNSRTAIVSKSEPLAKTFLKQIKRLLSDADLYRNSARNLIDDYGPFMPEGDGWASNEIYVARRTTGEKDPTVKAFGVAQQIYGHRFDRIKFDDIATLRNQRNPDVVADLLQWIDKEALSRIGKSGQAVFIGTRVLAGDIYSVLAERPGYVVIRYPVILDENEQIVLWPEHFPWEQVMIHRGEMTPADFQLIYQNVDMPGVGATFPPELVESCFDPTRQIGDYAAGWRLIAGLDPAGGSDDSGWTAFVLVGVDLETGRRHLIDLFTERSMKAPQIYDLMMAWSTSYPISEWRVESNGLQSQLVQYNRELIQALALKGVRVVPHVTSGHNKWDPQFGVESIAPLMSADLFSIPYAGETTQRRVRPLVDQLLSFPMGQVSDLVMALWFCEIGAKESLQRATLPMFHERTNRWPARVRRRRKVVDFSAGGVKDVPLAEQGRTVLSRSLRGRRLMTGRPGMHSQMLDVIGQGTDGDSVIDLANIDATIWHPSDEGEGQ